jgi:ribosomal protein L32
MEDRVNKPKRKKCPGSGKMSLPVERSYFGGVHHMCPDCGGYVGATEKKYSAPITVRPHMVNVQPETPPNTACSGQGLGCGKFTWRGETEMIHDPDCPDNPPRR